MRTIQAGFQAKCAALVAALLAYSGSALAQAVPLPEKIKDTKVLNISVSNDFPPMGYRDAQTKELSGLSTDIVRAIGANLGITFNLIYVAFPQVFPGLDTGRFDFVASSIVDFPVRRDKYTHVDYLKTGPQIFTAKANGGKIKDFADLCGRPMGYPRFIVVYSVILKELSDKVCVSNGKPAIVSFHRTCPFRSDFSKIVTKPRCRPSRSPAICSANSRTHTLQSVSRCAIGCMALAS